MNFRLAVIGAAAILAVACGGGGSGGSVGTVGTPSAPNATSNFVSGVVAVGAPLANAAVTITCRDESGTATTDAQGEYSAQFKATLPCLVKAVGTHNGETITMFGAVTGSGTDSAPSQANVTTLTHWTVTQALGANPEAATTAQIATLNAQTIQNVWQNTVLPYIQDALGVTYNGNPFAKFTPDPATDETDQLLETLKANNITPSVIVSAVNSGSKTGNGAEPQPFDVAMDHALDEAHRLKVLPTADKPLGTEVRIYRQGDRWPEWFEFNGTGASGSVTLNPQHTINIEYGNGFHSITGGASYSINDAAIQKCSANPSAYVTELVLVPSSSKILSESQWNVLMNTVVADGEDGYKMFFLNNCHVWAGVANHNGTPTFAERVALHFKPDGTAVLEFRDDGETTSHTHTFTAKQVRDALFNYKPLPRIPDQQPYDVYLKPYVHTDADDEVQIFMVLSFEPEAGQSQLAMNMMGPALLVEYDDPESN